jgi:hypothetical protein
MNQYLADDVVLRADGEEHMIDRRRAADIRAFEQALNTKWSYRIKGTAGERVAVELTEANDFYELLGIGKRTQAEHYFVRNGRIHRMETVALSHESGDYTKAYERFKRWLSTTTASKDPRLTRDGARPCGSIARAPTPCAPWLQRWATKR